MGAKSDKDLSTFVTAVTAGKLVTALEGKGPFTVFAPKNEAFEHLTPEVLKWLLEPEHIKELQEVLEIRGEWGLLQQRPQTRAGCQDFRGQSRARGGGLPSRLAIHHRQ